MRCVKHVFMLVMVYMLSSSLNAVAQTTTIEFWWGESAQTENMLALVEKFEAQHPHINVDLVDKGYMGGGTGLDQVKTAIAAGVAPDIVWMDAVGIFEQAVGDEIYIPLEEVIDRSFLESIPLLPGPRRYTTYNGSFLGLPFRTDARGLYFNQDLFESAGLDATRGPEDIATLDAYAARLTRFEADGSLGQLGFSTRGDNLGVVGWLWIFGGQSVDRERLQPTLTGNPRHLEALEWIASYAERYGADAAAGSANFETNKVAMFVQSTTWLTLFPQRAPSLRWSVGAIPHPPEGRKSTFSGGFGAVIPRGAKHPQEAGEFIKFLAAAETQIEWYERTRGVPARADALAQLIQEQMITDPRERTMLELLPMGGVYPPLDGVVTPELERNTQRMRLQEITPVQVLEDTQRAVQPIFDEVFGR